MDGWEFDAQLPCKPIRVELRARGCSTAFVYGIAVGVLQQGMTELGPPVESHAATARRVTKFRSTLTSERAAVRDPA